MITFLGKEIALTLSTTILIGAAASMMAAIIFFVIERLLIRFANWLKFKNLKGSYLGYSRANDISWEVDFKHPVSFTKITYMGRRTLKMVLTHGSAKDYVWEGIVLMNEIHADVGKIAWQYIKRPKNDREFGFKDLIRNRVRKELWLIGHRGYGVEILKEEKSLTLDSVELFDPVQSDELIKI